MKTILFLAITLLSFSYAYGNDSKVVLANKNSLNKAFPLPCEVKEVSSNYFQVVAYGINTDGRIVENILFTATGPNASGEAYNRFYVLVDIGLCKVNWPPVDTTRERLKELHRNLYSKISAQS